MHQALMFKHMLGTFVFEGYLRRTSNYLKRIILFDLTYMMSILDLIANNVEILRIESECSLRNLFY